MGVTRTNGIPGLPGNNNDKVLQEGATKLGYKEVHTGNMDLRPESHVSRIEHDDKGKVTALVYFDKDGKQQRQKARIVCVAGNAIETPRTCAT
jgi:choline dehydrogenase-like flavoprotein